MPNWCNNTVEISHPDRSKMEALASAVREGNFCKHIIPVPRELTDTVAPSREDPEVQAQLRAKYGAADWYDFCVNHWGTKWDVDAYVPEDVVVNQYNSVFFGFDSAWSPPVGIYEALVEQGFEVEAMYYEPGMAYCGVWQNGCDDHYDIGGMTSETVKDCIPESLDEAFSISECMAEYEEMEKDEVQVWYENGVEKKGLTPHEN